MPPEAPVITITLPSSSVFILRLAGAQDGFQSDRQAHFRFRDRSGEEKQNRPSGAATDARPPPGFFANHRQLPSALQLDIEG
jgi:hypothetical protein